MSEPRASTLVDLLRWRAERQPSALAFTFLLDGEEQQVSVTYSELDRRACDLAAELLRWGKPTDRALLLFPSGPDFVFAFVGCLYAGVVAVPVFPPTVGTLIRSMPKIAGIAIDASPRFALTSSAMLPEARTLLSEIQGLNEVHWLATDAPLTAERSVEPIATPESLAFLQYTSGSTSAPRGVMVSHGNLMHTQRMIQESFEHTAQSVALSWLPLNHDMGLIGKLLQPLYVGFPCVIMSPLHFAQRPVRWLQAISRFRATTSGAPNFAYDLCVRKTTPEQREALDLSSWDLAFSGSEPVCHDTVDAFSRTFAPCGFRRESFYPCYGLAEATLIASGGRKGEQPIVREFSARDLEEGRVASAGAGESVRRLVGCGRTMPDQEIAIVDPDSGLRCGETQVGEIWLRGPNVAQGYWNRPDDSLVTFGARTADSKDSEDGPFLRTGDLGFLRDGELFIVSRLKDLIIIDGRNHSPNDIERTVEACEPQIRPGCCAAFSVEVEGRERLVVVGELLPSRQRRSSNGAPAADDGPTAQIYSTIRRAVAEHHDVGVHTVLLLRVGAIPKTSSGKIRRRACRDLLLAGALETAR